MIALDSQERERETETDTERQRGCNFCVRGNLAEVNREPLIALGSEKGGLIPTSEVFHHGLTAYRELLIALGSLKRVGNFCVHGSL